MADNDDLMKPIIGVIITLFVLVIINAIVLSLPGMNTQIPGMYWLSMPAIISAIISIIMIVVVWRFGLMIGPIIQKNYPKIPESRKIVIYATYLVCLLIAYSALRYLLAHVLYNFFWIFDLAFLLVGLFLVYVLGTLRSDTLFS